MYFNIYFTCAAYNSNKKSNFYKIRTDQSVGLIPTHLDVVVIGYFADYYSAGIYRIAKKLVDPINSLIVAFSPWMLNKINNQEKIINSLELKLQGNEILYKAQKIDITQLIESKNELNDANNILLDLKSSKKYYLIDILILNGDLNTIINGLG